MLEAILGLNTQIASFQSNKLGEMAQLAAMKITQATEKKLPESSFNMKLSAAI